VGSSWDQNVKNMGMGQNLVPMVNIKIAGKWMFIPLKMYLKELIHTHMTIVFSDYHLVMTNIAMERSTMLLIGKPSNSMGHFPWLC
jgi:hypothetical protein